jgi:transcriptional regulator with PAS, ATPase and Fis domain
MFGYEKGSFTGASKEGKMGLFEVADGGTIFLDEVGELSPAVQIKLLRVLQEHEIKRIGGLSSIKVDVRIIAATNRNLEEMVKQNKFRKDLYYRLNVVPITIPPLRERRQDIFPMIRYFLAEIINIT